MSNNEALHSQAERPSGGPEIAMSERTRILEREIAKYVSQGYFLVSRTEITAQLVRQKQFNFGWALLWFLVFGVGLLVYILYYLGKQDKRVYIEIEPDGAVHGWESG